MSLQNKNVNEDDLTIEKVKQFKGFENISDEEAQNIAFTLKEFSLVAYRYFQEIQSDQKDTE